MRSNGFFDEVCDGGFPPFGDSVQGLDPMTGQLDIDSDSQLHGWQLWPAALRGCLGMGAHGKVA